MNHDTPAADSSPVQEEKSQVPVNLSGLLFRIARNDTERKFALECRWRGYRKYGFASPESCKDEFDDRATHYVSIDVGSGNVVGCLRMLSGFGGQMELEKFVDISEWLLSGARPAELTRFSVPLSKRSLAIKFGLWKLAWSDAMQQRHSHFIIWTRKEAQRNYDMLGFESFVGSSSAFAHPALGGCQHSLMTLDLRKAAEEYRLNRPALYQFFCCTTHSNITLSSDT